jgi:ABC-type lipoprotein export system ATPase subunit
VTQPKYPRGSEWSKWDLHVHTPASIVHHYNYPGLDVWDGFLKDLRSLPPEIKVVGINDYLFLDGYKRVRTAWESGDLPNLDLILPVVEFRLSAFGGTQGHLSRLNYHVIFSNELLPEIIEQQFLNALSSKYILSPDAESLGGSWNAIATRESLSDLGRCILRSVPEERRTDFGPPMLVGFNNCCITPEALHLALQSHYFADKYITAIGKTEWADIKWNEQSIASKKTLINRADLVFMSAESGDHCRAAQQALANAQVNSRLLDCSDAHHSSTSRDKDRLGKCFTWIKATPTFNGLRQVLHDTSGRLHIGDAPMLLTRVTTHSTQYIRSLTFNRTGTSLPEELWFNGTVPFNDGLVAVIGNKGSGKSALADILALAGNCYKPDKFSFLTKGRFLAPKTNLGALFTATIEWRSGPTAARALSDHLPRPGPELVKYIPQNHLDTVCSPEPSSGTVLFDAELMDVIYSHVPESKRLGKLSLSDLITYKTKEKEHLLAQLLAELRSTNELIEAAERQLTVEHRQGIEARITLKAADLDVHVRSKPAELIDPSTCEEDPAIQLVRAQLLTLVGECEELDSRLVDEALRQQLAAQRAAAADKLLARISNLSRTIDAFYLDSVAEAALLGIDVHATVSLLVSDAKLREIRDTSVADVSAASQALDSSVVGSLAQQRSSLSARTSEVRSHLDAPNQRYQEYLHNLAQWEKRRGELEGTPAVADSIVGLRSALTALSELPAHRESLNAERAAKVREIFMVKQALLDDYKTLYAPVQSYINEHPVSQQQGALQFNASMVLDNFETGLFGFVHHGRKGSFQGQQSAQSILKDVVSQAEVGTIEGVELFIDAVYKRLNNDVREAPPVPVRIQDQVGQGVAVRDVYDYLFGLSYLKPRFEIRWRGKHVDQLSPGERGTLLLVFYLLIDNRTVPLIIDQPEENLDNQTIATLLVPAIKYAKNRRQVIMVTHNPNLAVVCDADQVVYAQLDKQNGNRVSYVTGGIENPVMTRLIVDVLEGTKPAFDLRDARYEPLDYISEE